MSCNKLPETANAIALNFLAGSDPDLLALLQKCPPRINEEGSVEFLCPTFEDAGAVVEYVSVLAPRLLEINQGKVSMIVDGQSTFQFDPAAVIRYAKLLADSTPE